MKGPTGNSNWRDQFLRQQEEIIARVGWMVLGVFPTKEAPCTPFAYTVGLTSKGHPELIIAGVDIAPSQTILNNLATRVHGSGERFTHGQQIDDLLVGYQAVIVDGPAIEALHPSAAFARYGRDAVALQQIVWPDPDGRFPWDAGYAYPADTQPLIGQP